MDLPNLFAELQANPKNLNAYRMLIRYYDEHGMTNESQAFQELLEEIKRGPDDPNPNPKQ